MIDPSEIVDNLVALLRLVPALVDEVNGDQELIYSYHDQYPKRASLLGAVRDMPAPGVMVAWTGTAPGSFGPSEVWRHQITIYLRSREVLDGEDTAGYYRLFRQIVRGTPTGSTVPMNIVTVHASCYPMDVPTITRETDAEGLDYFEIQMNFAEIFDE